MSKEFSVCPFCLSTKCMMVSHASDHRAWCMVCSTCAARGPLLDRDMARAAWADAATAVLALQQAQPQEGEDYVDALQRTQADA